MNKQSFIPEGYNAVMPALAIQNASKAIKWYKDIFGAEERMVFNDPSGGVAHAELVINGSLIMLGEENLQYNRSPKTLNGNSVNLYMYVKDVDTVLQKAVDNGARLIAPAEDMFYGDRSGRIEDPFGYLWIVSTHIKDVSTEEMEQKMKEMMSEGVGG